MVNETFMSLGGQFIAALRNKFVTPSSVIDVNALHNFVGGASTSWDGDKFLGGFGITKDYEVVNHWLIRKRSKQLFTENIYARGIIRRLITNIINKGLSLEATPDAEILGLDPESLAQ